MGGLLLRSVYNIESMRGDKPVYSPPTPYIASGVSLSQGVNFAFGIAFVLLFMWVNNKVGAPRTTVRGRLAVRAVYGNGYIAGHGVKRFIHGRVRSTPASPPYSKAVR